MIDLNLSKLIKRSIICALIMIEYLIDITNIDYEGLSLELLSFWQFTLAPDWKIGIAGGANYYFSNYRMRYTYLYSYRLWRNESEFDIDCKYNYCIFLINDGKNRISGVNIWNFLTLAFSLSHFCTIVHLHTYNKRVMINWLFKIIPRVSLI